MTPSSYLRGFHKESLRAIVLIMQAPLDFMVTPYSRNKAYHPILFLSFLSSNLVVTKSIEEDLAP
jgi:hypothetical protein